MKRNRIVNSQLIVLKLSTILVLSIKLKENLNRLSNTSAEPFISIRDLAMEKELLTVLMLSTT